MVDAAHFDRRGADYDRDAGHRRIAALLIEGMTFEDGCRVLDIATGTGLVALAVAEHLPPTAEVLGIDIAEGMLAAARRKAGEARYGNLRFETADAERLDFPVESFDRVFCCSALVMMRDAQAALRRWGRLLRRGGRIAFDVPAVPFGPAQRIAAAANRHGVRLGYATLADTPAKCRALVAGADLSLVDLRTVTVTTEILSPDAAIAFYDARLDHPAWRDLAAAAPATRAAIRADYIRDLAADTVDGGIASETALNFVTAEWRARPD